MELWFYLAAQGDWTDKFISWVTWGLFSHCELFFPRRHLCFSSSMRDGGCRVKLIPNNREHWRRLQLPCSWEQEASIWAWCDRRRGLKYDHAGAVFGPWFGWKHDDDRWYCSEICSAVLRDFGILPDLPHHLSPSSLWEFCKRSEVCIEL
jgi:hypothetical protein